MKPAFEIIHLPKEQWQDYILPLGYVSQEYYDLELAQTDSGFSALLTRKRFEPPVAHTPEEHDFADKLYAEWWPEACAWGVLDAGKLVAAIETCPEGWSNRLRITELWVDEAYRNKGLGRALMNIAKEQAMLENRRAIILETQSCNVNAIGFYLHEGFTLIGFDSCCYSNRDIARREVRLELGLLRERKARLTREDVQIRPERPADYHAAEAMTRRAFWNKFRPGCDEHYLVHKLRNDGAYLPELSRIAVKDGEILGGIYYSRAHVEVALVRHEVLCFGPLCVDPAWHGCGVGELLLRETMLLAADAGYAGIIITGVPEYYPRVGFKPCDRFGITTADGKNFSAFMGIELQQGGFANLRGGKFHHAPVFDALTAEDAAEYDRRFPPMQKQYFPLQF